MPKMLTETRHFGRVKFIRVVNFNQKTGFTCKLPEEAASVLGISEVRGETLKQCNEAFEKAVKDWTDSKTKTRKVILYSVERNAHITDSEKGDDGEYKFTRLLLQKHDIHFTKGSGLGLAVTAGVYTEHEITVNGAVRFNYEWIAHQFPSCLEVGDQRLGWARGEKARNCMDWTPERHEFFEKIASGLSKLILMFEQLQDAEKALAIADSGKLLIPDSK